jgi:hypothetical protein
MWTIFVITMSYIAYAKVGISASLRVLIYILILDFILKLILSAICYVLAWTKMSKKILTIDHMSVRTPLPTVVSSLIVFIYAVALLALFALFSLLLLRDI